MGDSLGAVQARAPVFRRSRTREWRVCGVEGLGPGALKIMVKAALGPPDESGETGTGDGAGVWFWYKRGIQFNFNKQGVTNVMSIFDPEMSIEEQLL